MFKWFTRLVSNYNDEQEHKNKLSNIRKNARRQEEIEAAEYRLSKAKETGKQKGERIIQEKLNPSITQSNSKNDTFSSKLQKLAKNAGSMNQGLEGFMAGSFDDKKNKGKKPPNFFTMEQ